MKTKLTRLTPNPDTIYLNPFYDTTAGPMVVEIPPADADHVIVGSFDVAWQNALADVGPAGADKGKREVSYHAAGLQGGAAGGVHRVAVGDLVSRRARDPGKPHPPRVPIRRTESSH
jgi:hypothetical protein